MTKSISKTLLHLLKDFKSTEYSTEIDFIQKCINVNRFSSEDVIIDYFLKLTQCEEFLNKIAKDFTNTQKFVKVNEEYIKCLIFFLIFILDAKNANEIVQDPVFYTIPLLNYLCLTEKYPVIAKWATQYFDNDFVVHDVLEPLLGRVGAFKALIRYIEQEEQKWIPSTHLTIPKPFNLSGPGPPPPPANTPDLRKSDLFLAKKCRYVTYESIQKKIEREHRKHVAEAKELLDKVKSLKVPIKTKSSESTILTEVPIIKRFIPKKVPRKKEVEIKGNIATTLRDAALLIKDQEEEVKKIENILKGGCCTNQIEEAIAQERQNNEKKAWEDIQKKHLQGLLTFEESILAKKKLLDENRAKFLEIQAEKINLYQKLEEFKEKEQEKVKAQVEKCHKEKEGAKEIEKKFLEKKIEEARIQQYELKEMLKKREQEKAEELSKKMELIQEIKNLHAINCKMSEARKEFDPAETSNLGLLCEMSITELRERLAIEKIKMNDELDEKRKKIQIKKRQQQNMIDGYKEFVANTRKAPKIIVGPVYTPPKLEENDELQALRKQLEEKRSLRITM